ncbi:MAG: T9SS type A sorting domain-containing protein [Bacteroidia bacterium]|nr:T9SS type A sorting domain-containing protein [Bacteroidia bacterium]
MKKLLLSCMLLFGITSSYAQCLATSTPTNDGTDGDAIDSFTLNGVASIGNSGCPSNGYNSFSTPVRTLGIGGTYTFAAATGGPYGYDEGLAIWIDLNNDGTYQNSEQVYASSSYGTFHTGSLTIPTTASIANNIKMRVRCAYYTTIANNEACTDDIGGYGETEDYLVDIVCPAAPTISIAASNTLLCLGETATLTASGASNYTWTGGITNGVGFTPMSSASYTVTSSVPGCPSSSATAVKVVSVTSTPLTVTASISSAAACGGNTVQLNGFGASNYTWNPGNITGSSPVITATANTTFTMIGYNGSGCPGAATVGMTVTTPTITIAASSTTVCPGTLVTLTVSGASTYTWATNNSTNTTISLNPSSPVNISVIGTASNCPATANQFIMVNPAPSLSISASKTLVCTGSSVALGALGVSDDYQWSSGSIVSADTVHPINTTIYTLTGTFNNTGCSATTTIEITVFKPTISISPSSPTACPGSVLTLTASGGTSNYSWSPGGSMFTIQTVTANIPTTYTATASSPTTGGLNCPGTGTVMVNVFPNPNIGVTVSSPEICKGEGATITGTGGVTYTWTGTNTNSASINVNPVVGYYVYSVQGTDANGCVGSGTVSLKVNSCAGLASYNTDEQIFSVYPNPNNGTFVVESSSSLKLTLTNELGQVVKTLEFEGMDKEQVSVSELPKGVYFIIGENNGNKISRKVIVVQ